MGPSPSPPPCLQSGGPAALEVQLLPLLSELGTELAGLVSDPITGPALRQEWSEEDLSATMQQGRDAGAGQGVLAAEAARMTALLGLLQRLGQLMLQSGAPARWVCVGGPGGR